MRALGKSVQNYRPDVWRTHATKGGPKRAKCSTLRWRVYDGKCCHTRRSSILQSTGM